MYNIYDKNIDFNKYSSDIAKARLKHLFNLMFSKYGENITDIRNIGNTLNNNLYGICNYFISCHSNGFTEGLHSRIRRDLSNTRGFKNKDYMVYRIEKKFS